jgi:hypothetical protein
LRDALKIAAEEEDAAQGSPSPAPRSWRSRIIQRDKKLSRSPSQRSTSKSSGAGDAKQSTESLRREDTSSSIGSTAAASQNSDISGGDIFDKDQPHGAISGSNNGIFSISKLGPKIAETGKELSRQASNGSLRETSPEASYRPWGTKAKSTSGWLKRMMTTPEKGQGEGKGEAASPATESPTGSLKMDSSPAARPSIPLPDLRTPNKSFAWQADADFTAGDLQVSNSPPVKTGSSLETSKEEGGSDSDANNQSPEDDISKVDVDKDSPPQPVATKKDVPDGRSDNDERPSSRHIFRSNTKIDEIRAREIETLTKRALATARLDEIRERNAESRSGSSSPEIIRKPSRDLLGGSSSPGDNSPKPSDGTGVEDTGEPIPNTPVTVFRRSKARISSKTSSAADSPTDQEPSISREDSQELLRRLARAASGSPASDQQAGIKEAAPRVAGSEKSDSGDSGPAKKSSDETKPAVGFIGLHRESSTESGSDKRSSFAPSENDPTERIEREMQLFAPLENHSERGSIREFSPESDDEVDVDETPRLPKSSSFDQATPKVTGAYVETPATIKPERAEIALVPDIVEPDLGQKPLKSSLLRGRDQKQALSVKGDKGVLRTLSLLSNPRARSLPRARSPLSNSAPPPTVKDDLLEIHRAHQIEDSTLDDFDDLLAQQGAILPILEEPIEAKDIKLEGPELDEILSREQELEAYDRMSRSLKTGLEGIKEAKKGIERLEDKVAHAETKPATKPAESLHDHTTYDASCAVCVSRSSDSMIAYVRLPVPRLWYWQPRFKFTLSGLLVLLVSIWWSAESTMCFMFCKPSYCEAGRPCNWSYEDPVWGQSLPVKIDQWATGGRGREFVNNVRPDIIDWTAQVWESITGLDLTRLDTSQFGPHQRQLHMRRLMKRGLLKPLVERPEDKSKHAAWRAAAAAKERADAVREMGYVVDEDESMTSDRKVSR